MATAAARKPDAPPRIVVRAMTRHDIQAAAAVDQACYEEAAGWQERDFARCLEQNNLTSGLVAERGGRVAGFAIYQVAALDEFQLLNLAVHPDCRRKGVGRALVNKLKDGLRPGGRDRIVFEVRESNLPACQFFRSLEFKAVLPVLRGRYTDPDDDGYTFEFRKG